MFVCIFFSHKILGGMAKSVDPDHEQPELGLHCLHMSLCHKVLCAKVLDNYHKRQKSTHVHVVFITVL